MENVYRKKEQFVEKLKPALQMLPGIEDATYRAFADHYAEYVRVEWEDGSRSFVDVTGDSYTAMLAELSRLAAGDDPTGLISGNHCELIAKWFREAEMEGMTA